MNKCYSKVWNPALGQMVVASELASRNTVGTAGGSSATNGALRLQTLTVALLLSLAGTVVVPSFALAADAVCRDPVTGVPVGTTSGAGNEVACGDGAVASGSNATAIGAGATAAAGNSIAIGVSASVSAAGGAGIAIGGTSSAGGALRATSATNAGATALGPGAQASGIGAVALGDYATASGNYSAALGTGARAIGTTGMAFGNNSLARAADTAFGAGALQNSVASGSTVAVGINAAANAVNATESVFVGATSGASVNGVRNVGTGFGAGNTSVGNLNTASGNYALGYANGSSNVGVGNAAGAVVTGSNNVSIGHLAGTLATTDATGTPTGVTGSTYSNAISVGANSKGMIDNAVAIGTGATAIASVGDVALGSGSVTAAAVATPTGVVNGTTYNYAGITPTSTVSVGAVGAERTVTNVAAGRVSATSTDAINGSQLFATNQAIAAAQTHYYSVKSTNQAAGSNYNNDGALGTDSLAAGVNAATTAAATNATAVGYGSLASGAFSTAIGDSTASNSYATSMGNNSTASGANSVAIGGGATGARAANATGLQSIAIGMGAGAGGSNSIAMGAYSAAGNNSVALGNGANASQAGTIAVGEFAYSGVDAIHIGNSTVNGNNSNLSGAFRRGSTLIGDSANSQGLYSTVIGNGNNLVTNENIRATGLFGQQFVAQGALSNILGAYNTIGTRGTSKTDVTTNNRIYSGVAVTAVGSANNVQDSNGAFVAGYGNTITDSYDDEINVSGILEALNASGLAGVIADEATKLGQVAVIGAGNSLNLGNNALVMGMRNKVNGAVMSQVAGFNQTATNVANAFITGTESTVSNSSDVFVAGSRNTVTNATDVLAMGSDQVIGSATTTAANSILLGDRITYADTANSQDSVAIGSDTRVASGAVAVGVRSQALGPYSIAIGYDAIATGSVAMGLSARAGNGGSAFGDGAVATYLGGATVAGTVAGSALGKNAIADISGATSVGTNSSTTVADGVALGSSSAASVAGGAIGYNPTNADAAQIAAIQATNSTTLGAVSVGTGAVGGNRQIVNVAAGTNDSDAVNVAQLKAAQASSATHYYSVNDGGVIQGNYNNDGATGVNSMAAGASATAATDLTTAVGYNAGTGATVGSANTFLGSNSGNNSEGSYNNYIGWSSGLGAVGDLNIAMGLNAGAVAIGNQNIFMGLAAGQEAQGSFNIASGTGAGVGVVGQGNVSFGAGAGTLSDISTGLLTPMTASDTVAIGTGAVASASNAVAIGGGVVDAFTGAVTTPGAQATLANSVALGSNSVANTAAGIAGYVPPSAGAAQVAAINATTSTLAAVSVGDAANGQFRQITSVAAGTADSDAVNVAQLRAAEAVANAGWNVTAQGTNGTNVALNSPTGNDVDLNNADGNIDVTKATDSNDVTFDLADDITVDSVNAGGTILNNAGITLTGGSSLTNAGLTIAPGSTVNMGGNVVTGVAPAALNPTSTDAVNGSQLYQTNNIVNNLGNTVAAGIGPSTTYNSTTGAITTVLNVAGNTYTTVEDAINSVAGSAYSGWTVSAQGANGSSVASGEAVDLNNTDGNILVSKTTADDNVSFNLAKDITVDSVTAGGTVINNTGMALTNGSVFNTTNVTVQGGTTINMGNNVVSGVGAGAVNPTSTDAVNGSQLYNNAQSVANNFGGGSTVNVDGTISAPTYTTTTGTYNNVGAAITAANNQTNTLGGSVASGMGGGSTYDPVTGTLVTSLTVNGNTYNNVNDALQGVNSVANAGWNISAQGANTSNVGPNDTVDLNNTDGNIVVTKTVDSNDVTFNLAKDIKVDSVDAGGTVVNNAGVTLANGTALTATNVTIAGGTTINMGNNVVGGVAAGAVTATSTDAVNGSQLHNTATTVANNLGGGSTVNPDGTVTAPTYNTSTGTYNNVGDAITAANNQTNALGGSVASGMGGGSTYDPVTGQLVTSLTVNGNTYNNVNDALQGVNAVANAGWNISADGANSTTVKPGASVDMGNTDGNIVITKSTTNNDINFDLAKNIKVDSVVLGNGTTTVNQSGLIITNGPSITTGGINAGGMVITNVKAGVNATDAVNVSQLNASASNTLNQANSYTDIQINGVRQDLWRVERGYKGGTASAMAMAALPQAYLPGKNMAAIAASHYQGEAGMAVGVSAISDNGRYVYKLNGSGNTTGEWGVAVGAGVQW